MVSLTTFLTELKISFRYLQSRNKERFISINTIFSFFGIMIGVAALMIVMSVMNGFREELASKIIGLNSDVIVKNYNNKPIRNFDSLTKKIKQVTNVTRASGVISKQGLLLNKNVSAGVMIKSTPLHNMLEQKDLRLNLDRIKNFKSNHIILGHSLAIKLRVKIGDKLSLLSPEFSTTILGRLPKMKDFYVSDIIRTGLTEFDETVAFIPIKTAQNFYDMEESVNLIEVFTNQHSESSLITMKIKEALDFQYIVKDWQQIHYSLFNALKTERVAMFTILTLIIIVAAFNIVSSLTMLVMDKEKEIAILKTIGMQNSSIVRIFFYCGIIISFLALFSGLIIGYYIAENIQTLKVFLSEISGTDLFDPVVYYLDSLPSKTKFEDVRNIALIVFVATIFATLYPAIKAGKTNPVDVLKSK